MPRQIDRHACIWQDRGKVGFGARFRVSGQQTAGVCKKTARACNLALNTTAPASAPVLAPALAQSTVMPSPALAEELPEESALYPAHQRVE
jgi:hypothetical protein